jgi:HEPN domain-containing protein
MDAQEKYEQWLERAQYDLDSVDAMYNTGRWMYVAFMCQQAIEKLCKGLYVLYVSDEVPRVHNISSVVARYADSLPEAVTDEKYRLFDYLTAFYMEGRYPEYKQKLYAQLNELIAKNLLAQAKEVFAWLQTLKP